MLFTMKLLRKTRKIIMASLVSCLFVLVLTTPLANAQSIPITKSTNIDKVIFDGKWTFMREWKESSLTKIETQSGDIYLRTAHLEDYIYVMIDAVPDKTANYDQDQAVVCFDAKSDKNTSPDENDYCFLVKLGKQEAVTLVGSQETKKFEIIENHSELIAIGNLSDENDRYSKIPHSSYEFRIPIDLLERTDSYGFYVEIFDFAKSTTYTWPLMDLKSESEIPSPDNWGTIFSPDKSLPEYELPFVVLIIAVFSVIILSSKYRGPNLFYYNRQ